MTEEEYKERIFIMLDNIHSERDVENLYYEMMIMFLNQ